MKALVVCAAALLSFAPSVIQPAHAECYGDAATMYGCGTQVKPPPSKQVGSLEHFGDSRAPVLPDVAYSNNSSIMDEVVSPADRRRILRSVALGTGRRTYSQGTHIQAINNSGRPVRLSGSVGQGGFGR